jgi:hypothetical protein
MGQSDVPVRAAALGEKAGAIGACILRDARSETLSFQDVQDFQDEQDSSCIS